MLIKALLSALCNSEMQQHFRARETYRTQGRWCCAERSVASVRDRTGIFDPTCSQDLKSERTCCGCRVSSDGLYTKWHNAEQKSTPTVGLGHQALTSRDLWQIIRVKCKHAWLPRNDRRTAEGVSDSLLQASRKKPALQPQDLTPALY
jgi:hypothetical protein